MESNEVQCYAEVGYNINGFIILLLQMRWYQASLLKKPLWHAVNHSMKQNIKTSIEVLLRPVYHIIIFVSLQISIAYKKKQFIECKNACQCKYSCQCL